MSGAGDYSHRVAIQRNTAEPAADGDAVGEVAPQWTTIAPRWAAVEPLTGREYVAAQQSASDTTHNVRLRADSITKTITPRDRLLFGSRVLQITGVRNPEERGVEILLTCVETTEE